MIVYDKDKSSSMKCLLFFFDERPPRWLTEVEIHVVKSDKSEFHSYALLSILWERSENQNFTYPHALLPLNACPGFLVLEGCSCFSFQQRGNAWSDSFRGPDDVQSAHDLENTFESKVSTHFHQRIKAEA